MLDLEKNSAIIWFGFLNPTTTLVALLYLGPSFLIILLILFHF